MVSQVGRQPLVAWTVGIVCVLVISSSCLASGHLKETPEFCAHFEFPDLPDLNFTVLEDSIVNISVHLVFNTLPPQTTPSTTTNNDDNNNDNNKDKKKDDNQKDQEADRRHRTCLEKSTLVMGASLENATHKEGLCYLRVTAQDGCESFSSSRCNCTAGGVFAGGGPAGGRTFRLSLQLTTKGVGRRGEGWWWRWWTRDGLAPPARLFLAVSDKAPEDREKGRNQHNDNDEDNSSEKDRTHVREFTPNSSNNNSNDDIKTGEGTASTMKASSIWALLAGLNFFTVIVIRIAIFVVRRCRQRRQNRRRLPPLPCGVNAAMTQQRCQIKSGDYSSANERFSTSSWLYDEIPADVSTTFITTDTSLYLHPIACTPTTTTTTASATTSTTITFAK